jgi:hypothetical protein
MESFGIDTVTFVSLAETGTTDALGVDPMTPITFDAENCRHRPLTFKETAELTTDVATEYWRTTIPLFTYDKALVNKIRAVKPIDKIKVDDITYQIVGGVRPFKDEHGYFKATILSQRQTG